MTREQVSKEDYIKGMSNIADALKQMGYTKLRDGQGPPIFSLMKGTDTICVLPTAAGKSACFMMPILTMKWRAVIFSPLIALMRDQVQSACRAGIRAACCTSVQSTGVNNAILKEWSQGYIDLLYVAPERLDNPVFKQALSQVKPDMVIMDEAHCLSQWGNDFRPSYVRVGEFIDEYKPRVSGAFTATATEAVVADIKRVMRMDSPFIYRHCPVRENLHLSSSKCEDNELFYKVADMLRERKGAAIVYCQTTQMVNDLVYFLSQGGESATWYHAKMENKLKDQNQDEFMSGRARICVATNAFGMGIDKPDIETIIHCGLPGSVEAVAQETGRAARDGRDAVCHMFVYPDSIRTQEWFWNCSNPTSDVIMCLWRMFEQRCDENREVRLKSSEMAEITGLGTYIVDGALGVLMAKGCIERFYPEARPTRVLVYARNDAPEKKALLETMRGITDYGNLMEDREDGSLYEIMPDFLAGKLGKVKSTIKVHMSQLARDKFIAIEAQFRGKATKLLKAPDSDVLRDADKRRETEFKKLKAVRDYANTPDEDKHNFIQAHFELE